MLRLLEFEGLTYLVDDVDCPKCAERFSFIVLPLNPPYADALCPACNPDFVFNPNAGMTFYDSKHGFVHYDIQFEPANESPLFKTGNWPGHGFVA